MNPRPLSHIVGAALFFSGLAAPLSDLRAQGSLTPPGAPAPTMKSLDQIEPRTAITNLPAYIGQSGSYYLTRSFEQVFVTDAVTITTNNVTLDLNGFTIRQVGTNAAQAGLYMANRVNVPLKNVSVRNGTIAGFNAPAINAMGIRNCIFENLVITECSAGGISVQSYGTAGAVGNVVRHCRLCDNTGSGVVFLGGAANSQNLIEDCDSLNNTTGFSLAASGNLIIRCRASGNTGNNYTMGTGNRCGVISLPATNSVPFNGSSGGTGSGNTDPFGNLSF
jgi:hypothetical protein